MSSNQKNNYPLEFKISSAQLAIDSDKSVAQTARDLGINHNTLHGWIDKYSDSNQIDQKNMSNNPRSVISPKSLMTVIRNQPFISNYSSYVFAV